MAKLMLLLKLPAEIRVKIFDLALAVSLDIPVQHTPALLQALRSNFTLYNEALEIYFKGNLFEINEHNFQTVKSILPEVKQMVRHLSIVFTTVTVESPKFQKFVKKGNLITKDGQYNYENARRETGNKRVQPEPHYRTIQGFRRLKSLRVDAVDFPFFTFHRFAPNSIETLVEQTVRWENNERLACRFFQIVQMLHNVLKEVHTLTKLSVKTGDCVKFGGPRAFRTGTQWFASLALDNHWVESINDLTVVKAKLSSVIGANNHCSQTALDERSEACRVRHSPAVLEQYRISMEYFWDIQERQTLLKESLNGS